ncbi:hypothetical protein [Solimonas soli]|uniref:hypothetical protein n=1 Tax=Solimonas soli TaxID=413479 RepID=UPI000486F628|nr:hypothetical protein [Solimonas soli]
MEAQTVSPAARATVIVLLWLGATCIVAYWLAFFLGGSVQASSDACYLVFERSFPLPDGFVALCAVLAAEGLRRRRASAVAWALLTAGGFFFVGLIDINYNLGNGMYARHSGAMMLEMAINIACLVLAGGLSVFCWTRRRALGA